jgi:hypothetical protein
LYKTDFRVYKLRLLILHTRNCEIMENRNLKLALDPTVSELKKPIKGKKSIGSLPFASLILVVEHKILYLYADKKQLQG